MSKKSVKIDGDKFRAVIAKMGKTQSEVSQELGTSYSYVSRSCTVGEMSETAFNLFCMMYGQNREDLLSKEEETVKAPEAEGYHLHLNVTPTIVTVSCMFGQEVLYIGRSKVKGESELDLMQAISYAAHMIYKAAEQKELARKVEGNV